MTPSRRMSGRWIAATVVAVVGTFVVVAMALRQPPDPVAFLSDRAVVPVVTTDLEHGWETRICLPMDRRTVKDLIAARVGPEWRLESARNGNYSFENGSLRIVTIAIPTKNNPAPPGTRAIVLYGRPKLAILK